MVPQCFQIASLNFSGPSRSVSKAPVRRNTVNFSRFDYNYAFGGQLNQFQQSRRKPEHVALCLDLNGKDEVAEATTDDNQNGPCPESPKTGLVVYQSPPSLFLTVWNTFRASPMRFYKMLALIAENSSKPKEANLLLYTLKMYFGFYTKTPTEVAFDDFLGFEEPITELKTIMSHLKSKTDITIPNGLLIYGPVRSGKTTLINAMAREAEVTFFFIEAKNLGKRDYPDIKGVFSEARMRAPSIIAIEDIDKMTSKPAGSNEPDQLGELKKEINQFTSDKIGVLVIATTNMDPHTLDPFLTRSGLFKKTVKLHLPNDEVKRELVFKKLKDWLKEEDKEACLDLVVSKPQIANVVQIRNIVREAKTRAQIRGKTHVSIEDIVKGIVLECGPDKPPAEPKEATQATPLGQQDTP